MKYQMIMVHIVIIVIIVYKNKIFNCIIQYEVTSFIYSSQPG